MANSLLMLGAFLHLASGMQGGVVFGGKLFYPALMLTSIVCQQASLCFKVRIAVIILYPFRILI